MYSLKEACSVTQSAAAVEVTSILILFLLLFFIISPLDQRKTDVFPE